MQQLLQITSRPIEYRMEIEPSRLQYKQHQPSAQIQSAPAKLNLKTQDIQVRIDTMDMRRSLGFQTNTDRAREGAQRGKENAIRYSSEQVQFGKQISQIQDGIKIADVVRQKMFTQPESYTTFLPSTGPRISWVPNQIETTYQAGSLRFNWDTLRNSMEYVRGKCQMSITQYPSVEIEYLGGPIYIPRSADPNYAETV